MDRRLPRLLLAAALLAAAPARAEPPLPVLGDCKALDLTALPGIDAALPRLLDKRVLFVGESHDRYEHHLAQLEVIRRFHQAHPDLAIALEQFPQSAQIHLDDYIAGRIDERTLLHRSDYYRVWRFDYRLYRPILRFAREEKIPLLALNVPSEVSGKVAAGGFAALEGEERRWIPAEVDRDNARYRRRIREAFDHHPEGMKRDFENFLSAQLLWDEGMAQRAAEYLKEYPERRLAVLAGSGHLIYGDGIPSRLQRRLTVPAAVVLNGIPDEFALDMADLLLFPAPQELPEAGKLGIWLGEREGTVIADRLDEKGAAAEAGMKAGDRILAVEGVPLFAVAELRLQLLDKAPGERVRLTIRRDGGWLGRAEQHEVAVTLK